MKVLLFEDDPQHAGFVEMKLREKFPGVECDRIQTEKEFREQLTDIVDAKYDVIVLDVMAPWMRPSRDSASPPDDVVQEGFFRAGVRCYDLLRANDAETARRVIFYTILDTEALGVDERAKVINKNADPELRDLLEAIKLLHGGS